MVAASILLLLRIAAQLEGRIMVRTASYAVSVYSQGLYLIYLIYLFFLHINIIFFWKGGGGGGGGGEGGRFSKLCMLSCFIGWFTKPHDSNPTQSIQVGCRNNQTNQQKCGQEFMRFQTKYCMRKLIPVTFILDNQPQNFCTTTNHKYNACYFMWLQQRQTTTGTKNAKIPSVCYIWNATFLITGWILALNVGLAMHCDNQLANHST